MNKKELAHDQSAAAVIAAGFCDDKDKQLRALQTDNRKLQVSIEKLQTANEELQAINQQLRAQSRKFTEFTELRSAYVALRKSEQRFRDLVEGSIQGMMIHRDFKALFVNQALADILGYRDIQEILARESIIDYYAVYERERLRNKYYSRLRGEQVPAIYEIDALRCDGAIITLQHSIRMIQWEDKPAIQVLVVDVTQRKQAENALKRQADYDALTLLPNRMLLMDRLKQQIRQADRKQETLYLLFIDLDGFKDINDAFGHDVGDELLKQAATRLERCARESDTVARFGGDEFVLVLAGVLEADAVTRVIDEILAQLHQPFSLRDNAHRISASIGIAIYPQDTRDINTLIRYADTAMYRVKEKGRNGFAFFQPSMNERAVERAKLKQAIFEAVEHKQFTLYYQPIFDIRENRIVGAEALLRWHHPTRGLLNPDRFIRVSEESGQIIMIGQWIIEQALYHAALWRRTLDPDFYVAVNISPRQLYEKTFFDYISRLCESDLCQLNFEITESIFLEKHHNVLETLRTVRDKGCRISIDDFGSGYSSLQYLQTFPVDTIKIDQGFIRKEKTIGKPNDAFVRAILAMAQGIGAGVIAEGVETQAQFDFLKTTSCRYMQGFFLCKPLTIKAFENFMKNGGDMRKPEI